MAKLYRTIKLTYNGSTYEIDVRTQDEKITFQDFSTLQRTLDGTLYEQYVTTNIKRTFSYSFSKCDEEVFDFFQDAYEGKLSGYAATLDREEDDGTFTQYSVIVTQPAWNDESVGTTGKIYIGVSVEILQK